VMYAFGIGSGRFTRASGKVGVNENDGTRRSRGTDGSNPVPSSGESTANPGAPGRDRGLGEPDRQAAATAQAGVVRSPVRDPMALLRNMVTAVSEALERQRGILDGRRHRQALSLPQPPAAGDPCNKVHSK
jgi:hypothetical protein